LLFRFRQTFNEGFGGSSAVHAAALVGPALILAGEEVVENGLHFLDRFEPSATAFNTEVFIEQRAMQTLDNAVGPARPRSASPDGQRKSICLEVSGNPAPGVGQISQRNHRILTSVPHTFGRTPEAVREF
jgi:hypothetical protein